MNRQLDQYPATIPNKYLTNKNNHYPDHTFSPSESHKMEDTDLFIFNGGQPEKNINHMPPQKQSTIAPYNNITKTVSQKTFPINYNTYNQNRTQTDNRITNNKNSIHSRDISQSLRPNHEQMFEPSHSDVYQYAESNSKKHKEDKDRHQFHHTFKYLQPESTPQTAQFIQIPPEHFNQHRQQLQPKKAPFIYQQNQQLNSLPVHVLPQHSIQQERNIVVSQYSPQIMRPTSRIFGNSMPPPSPRAVERVQQNVIPVNQQRSNYIQISQQDYQRYQEHMMACRSNQEELSILRLKTQELSSKQRFYWSENATLRQENTRLRDLVTHFEKREKELLRERQQLRTFLSQNINKYQQSTLEELGLLLERYRLQLQKKK